MGRWFSVDPVFQPWQSPYTSMDNNPICLNDPMGLDPKKLGSRIFNRDKLAKGSDKQKKAEQLKKDGKMTEQNFGKGQDGKDVKGLAYWDEKEGVFYTFDDAGNFYTLSPDQQKGKQSNVDQNKRAEDRKDFEHYPEVPTTGIAGKRRTVKTIFELAGASYDEIEIAHVEGKLRDDAILDAGMLAKTQEIIEEAKQNKNYKEGKPFYTTGEKGVVLGGQGGDILSFEETIQIDFGKIGDNIGVGCQPVTWAFRHANVKYWVEVDARGNMMIEFRMNDRLDLSANGSSVPYDVISTIMGSVWHGVLGSNENLQTRTEWSAYVPAGNIAPNHYITK